MTSMRIALVEDDERQVETISVAMQQAFPDVELLTIATESEFRHRLDDVVSWRPDVVVMDVMLRWTDPAPDMEPVPPEVQQNGFYRAGFRCAELLRSRGATTPIIFYTILGPADVERDIASPNRTRFLTKGASFAPLVQAIRESTALEA